MSELVTFLHEGELRRKLNHPEGTIVQEPQEAREQTPVRDGTMDLLAPGTPAEVQAQIIGLPALRLKRVLAFIDANLDKNISLAELARTVKMSVYYFATLFKRSTGHSPHRYILHRRVTRARHLLRDTQLSVLQVSLDLGFEHQNNFARAFRRVTGVTPTHFRRSHRLEA
jgi:AraC-like DNA-binding protein